MPGSLPRKLVPLLCSCIMLLGATWAEAERLLVFGNNTQPPSLIMLPGGETLSGTPLCFDLLAIPRETGSVLVHDLGQHATFFYPGSTADFLNDLPTDLVFLATSESLAFRPARELLPPDTSFIDFLAVPGNMLYATDQLSPPAQGGEQSETSDWDQDGIADFSDNCSGASNADQLDFDGDGQGDVCDADDDNDGTADTEDCAPSIRQSIRGQRISPKTASTRTATVWTPYSVTSTRTVTLHRPSRSPLSPHRMVAATGRMGKRLTQGCPTATIRIRPSTPMPMKSATIWTTIVTGWRTKGS